MRRASPPHPLCLRSRRFAVTTLGLHGVGLGFMGSWVWALTVWHLIGRHESQNVDRGQGFKCGVEGSWIEDRVSSVELRVQGFGFRV